MAEIISSQIDALGENENKTPGLRLGGQERPLRCPAAHPKLSWLAEALLNAKRLKAPRK
jgi:hypothetical protein